MIHYHWNPYLHVLINLGTKKSQICSEKGKIPIIYDSVAVFFRNGFILQQVFEKMFETIRIVQNCSKLIHLQGNSLMKSGVAKNVVLLTNMISPVRRQRLRPEGRGTNAIHTSQSDTARHMLNLQLSYRHDAGRGSHTYFNHSLTFA